MSVEKKAGGEAASSSPSKQTLTNAPTTVANGGRQNKSILSRLGCCCGGFFSNSPSSQSPIARNSISSSGKGDGVGSNNGKRRGLAFRMRGCLAGLRRFLLFVFSPIIHVISFLSALLTQRFAPLVERWSLIQYTHKITLLSVVVFGVLIVFFALLIHEETRDLSIISERKEIAVFYQKLGRLYVALEYESRMAVGNARWALANYGGGLTPPISRTLIWAAQRETDKAIENVFSVAHNGKASLPSSVLRRLFRSTVLADTRQKINYVTLTAAQLQPRREDYNVLLRDIANALMVSSTALLSSPALTSTGHVFESAFTSIASGYAVEVVLAGEDVLRMGPAMHRRDLRTPNPPPTVPPSNSTTTTPSDTTMLEREFQKRGRHFAQSLYRTEALTRVLLGGGIGGESLGYHTSQTALTRAPWHLADGLVRGTVWAKPSINLTDSMVPRSPATFPTDPATDYPADNQIVQRILNGLPINSYHDATATAKEKVRQVLYGILLSFSALAVLYSIFRWMRQQNDFVGNEVRNRNASIMHAVSVRVAEFAEAFATFSLWVPPPPLIMQGTPVATVEAQLQQCLSSLRTIAPSLPPLLFPTYFAKLAAEVTEVNDSKSASVRIANLITARDTLRKKKIVLLQSDDVTSEGNQFNPAMRELTALSARKAFAVVVTVDTFFFHDICSTQKRELHVSTQQHTLTQVDRERWANRTYTQFATCIEECAYQYGGVVHFAGLDRVTIVWPVDPLSEDDGEDEHNYNRGGGRRVSQRRRAQMRRQGSSGQGGQEGTASQKAQGSPRASKDNAGGNSTVVTPPRGGESAAAQEKGGGGGDSGGYFNTPTGGGGASSSSSHHHNGYGSIEPFLRPVFTPMYTSATVHRYSADGLDNGASDNGGGGGDGKGSDGALPLIESAAKRSERVDVAWGSSSRRSSSSSSSLHRMGGVGGASSSSSSSSSKGFHAPNACDAPTMCALAIASRLAHLKKESAGGATNDPFRLWSSIPIHIGVTAGAVLQGIFGTNSCKTLQLFGDPLERGLIVARVNQYSLTNVVCDETVRRVIEGLRHCKPVETLTQGNIGRIYEVIPPHVVLLEADLSSKLAAFNNAYSLYEGKFYREALRAFRAYTKQYGYDRTVERLQGVITGL